MRATLALTLMLLTGCGSLPSEAALCDGTKADRRGHAAALIEDGGPVSRRTGAALLSKFDAGCR